MLTNRINRAKKSICTYREDDANEIVPGLWLGNEKFGLDEHLIKQNKIGYIIRVMETTPLKKIEGVKYLHIPIKDENVCLSKLIPFFPYYLLSPYRS